MVYPAKGSPEFARQLQTLLLPEQAMLNETRGFDHGAWAVLKYLYPKADIPVVQLSLDRTKPVEWHYALAQKLRPLREQGVLILGSGESKGSFVITDLSASTKTADQYGASVHLTAKLKLKQFKLR